VQFDENFLKFFVNVYIHNLFYLQLKTGFSLQNKHTDSMILLPFCNNYTIPFLIKYYTKSQRKIFLNFIRKIYKKGLNLEGDLCIIIVGLRKKL